MKLKLSQITTSFSQLIPLSQVKGLNAKICYNLSKTLKSAIAEVQNYEKIRIEKLEQFSTKGEDGLPVKNESGAYDLTDENLKLFQEEMTALLDQEVEIYYTPISVLEIGHLEGISAECFRVLDWLFVD